MVSYSQMLDHRNAETKALDHFAEREGTLFDQYKKSIDTGGETWEYYTKDSILVFKVSYSTKASSSSEMYFLLHDKLQLVIETDIIYANTGGKDIWMCVYYFRNGKLIYYESLGHGKSESDTWNPESETLELFKKRFARLKQLAH
jgi:hypothetical protein